MTRRGESVYVQMMPGHLILNGQWNDVRPENLAGLFIDLRYDPDDPLAITMIVFANEQPVSWTFARSLLDLGVSGSTHLLHPHSDVIIFTNRDYVFIKLTSPNGQCLLRFSKAAFKTFLECTYISVPPSAEIDDEAMTAELNYILENGAY